MRIHDAYTKLNGPTRTDATNGTRDAGARAKDAGAAGKATGEVSTSVVLSARAQELSAKTDPARSARVTALRAQVQAGTFKIDPQSIAAKLVGDDS
jgi:flagellar biosynthesis anti-sigma factor FlgM